MTKYRISIHRVIQNSGLSPDHPSKSLKPAPLQPWVFGADDHKVPFFEGFL